MRGIEVLLLVSALLACHRAKPWLRGTSDAGTTAQSSADAGAPMTPFRVKGLDALGHKPLVALWEMNPWLMVIGSDVPAVVVYEDGLVIVHKVVDRRVDRIEGHLSKPDALALANRVDAGLAQSPADSEASYATDQPTVHILTRTSAGFREASCYGVGRDGASTTPGAAGSPAPAGFVAAYKAIIELNPTDPKAWVPDQIEVMLWGFDYAKDAKPWPADVPPPAANVVPPDSGVYHYDLPGKYETALKAHLSSSDGKTATELNGHRWAMSIRVRVPEEDFLMQARSCGFSHKEGRGRPAPSCE